jgi:hypothetical protein
MGRKRRLPKEAKETEKLTADEVMEAIFGKEGQQALKQQLLTDDEEPKADDQNSHKST